MTRADTILSKFRELTVWKRKTERAPHKPLLVLLALGRLQVGLPRLMAYDEIEPQLRRLLTEFGPPRLSVHPEYPFWRLQNDGVWEVDEGEFPLRARQSNTDPLKSELKKFKVEGGFPPSLFNSLKARPEIVRAIASELLNDHFPDSLHSAIVDAVGLDLTSTVRSKQRDPAFRRDVLAAWQHRCAFCGFHVQLDSVDLGLEAAHIRWVQAGGPETIDNGLACCAIHHQALDRGALTVGDDYRIFVSSRLHGSGKLDEQFVSLHRSELQHPNRAAARPNKEYLAWHRKEVFRGSALD